MSANPAVELDTLAEDVELVSVENADAENVTTADVLVEEVSIDGMCGVY